MTPLSLLTKIEEQIEYSIHIIKPTSMEKLITHLALSICLMPLLPSCVLKYCIPFPPARSDARSI